jgi:protein phosphatase
VDVDTFAVDGQPGDVFLICSDGLTDMLGDEEILGVVRENDSLEQAAKELVKQANHRGGADNITVVLFALAEGQDGLEETAPIATDGQGDVDDLEDTLTGLEAPTTIQDPEAEREPAAWGPPPEQEKAPPPQPAPAPERKPRWARRVILLLIALALVAALLVLSFWALANAHFVGAEKDGRIAVYQGLPYDLGVSLYRARYVSELRASQLSQGERRALFDHDLMSLADARARLAGLEADGLP